MDSDLSGRQIFLKAFVKNLIINSAPKYSQTKTEEGKKVQQIMPMNFEKNITQYLRENIPSLEKQNNVLKNFQMPQIKDLQKLDKQEVENRTLSDTKEEDEYEFREIRFPRANIIKEIDSKDKDKMQIGEITLEKVPLQKEKELLPMEPVKTQIKPLDQKIQPIKPGMQMKRSPMGLLQRPRPMPQIPKPNTSAPLQKSKFGNPSMMEKITILGLAKLDHLLQDPNVQNIECPGPNKPVLIYRSGAIQPTNIIFSADEIEIIMKEISDKTRIPLTTGVFKAALHRFVVTAVLSEFVGTRFIIQKKAQVEE